MEGAMRINDYGKRNSKRMNEGKGRGGCLREALSRGALTKTRVWRKLTGCSAFVRQLGAGTRVWALWMGKNSESASSERLEFFPLHSIRACRGFNPSGGKVSKDRGGCAARSGWSTRLQSKSRSCKPAIFKRISLRSSVCWTRLMNE